MWKKLHPVTFIDACWMFTETKQWMLAQWGSGWRVSAVATATYKTSHVPDGHAHLSHHEMKSVTISSSARNGGLLGNCVRSWISASMRWKRWWQRWNIAKFAPGGSHECSHRNINNSVMKFARTYWINTRLKVTVSWIASSPVTRRGVTTTSRSQNGSPWSGDMWIPQRRKSSRCCPQRVKWRALSFGIGKGWSFWISLNPDKHQLWPLHRDAKLKARISRVRPEKKTTFLLQHNNARPHTNLKTVEHIFNLGRTVVPHPPYCPDLAPSDFHLFGPIKDGVRGQHFPSNDAVVRAVKQWATSAGANFYERGCRFLFIAGESA